MITKLIEKKARSKVGCIHHWVIESAAGRESCGVCRHCGKNKQFYNSLPEEWDVSVMGKATREAVLKEFEPE
jgi:hypothetical protein